MRWCGDDFAFTAGHRQRALPEARPFHISLLSRCTAMLAGLRILIQTRHALVDAIHPLRDDAFRAQPANVREHSGATCSSATFGLMVMSR
jgi:hypothetical protein